VRVFWRVPDRHLWDSLAARDRHAHGRGDRSYASGVANRPSALRDRTLDVGIAVATALLVAGCTALAASVLRLPVVALLTVVLLATAGAVTGVVVRQRRRQARIRDRGIRYLQQPPLSSSELLPVGPSGETWTPVGEVLATPGLIVPQPWRRLTGPTEASGTDFAHELAALVDIGRSVLLVGDPGMGKSLTARRAFGILADRYRANPVHAPLPVLVPLGDAFAHPDGDDRGGEPFDPLRLRDLIAELTGLAQSDLAHLRNRGKLVLLLDALDESPSVRSLASIRTLPRVPDFAAVRLLTTRRDHYATFAGLPVIAGRFPVVVQLEKLPFDEGIRSFVQAYCDHFRLDEAATILGVLAGDENLRDLAARPLTLWMVVDVLASEQIADNRFDSVTLTSLYRRYTDKWLRIETTKADARVVGASDRRSLVRLSARAMFQAGIGLGGSLHSTAELAVSRDELADWLARIESGALVESLLARHGVGAVVDEICTRTFLVQGYGDGYRYRFTHKSFFEFFVALDLFACLSSEGRLEIARRYFERPLSDPIVYFFREMLAEAARVPEKRRVVCQNMFAILRSSGDAIDIGSQTVRQHVGNLVASVVDAQGENELVKLIATEPSAFVRRGIVVGLGLQRGRRDLVDAYVRTLECDPTSAAIHLGYTRVYHGDQEWNGRWEDDGGADVTRTVETQVDRLLSTRNLDLNVNLWPLTLFTLVRLLEDGRGWAPLTRDADAITRLAAFATTTRPDLGAVFESQREKLQHLLAAQGGVSPPV
jgi:hypothetical protein